MTRETGTFYITTPIYYVNDLPHIGHAYTSLACDVMARFMRLSGHKVKFLTGTDEHGQKVEKSAEKAGISPQDFTDKVSAHFRELAALMHFSNDDFIRTTEPRHRRSAQGLWNKLMANGHIYLGSYKGWYSVRDEAFYAESELIDGNAPTGAPVEWVEEPSYFFDLSRWQEKLLAYYEANPDFIKPESRRNEVLSFVRGGLHDLSVSRTSFKWGIPIPNDEKHVMYVWLDALANYLSALGYPDTETPDFKAFWPADLHVVGKDILRFHAVYWPAFLMAADLPLPKRVVAHGWWTNEGQKISKSLGNVIDPVKLVEEFGLNQTRYFLMREVPFGNDGNFSREGMIKRINADLANTIGNLVQRSLSLINKNCDAKIPAYINSSPAKRKCSPFWSVWAALSTTGEKAVNEGFVSAYKYFLSLADNINETMINYAKGVSKQKPGSFTAPLLEEAQKAAESMEARMLNQDFSGALEEILSLAHKANAYIDEQAPWALKKTDPVQMAHVLYILAETIRYLGVMLQPFIPGAAGQILDQLSIPVEQRQWSTLSPQHRLTPGTELPAPVGVFPRYVAEV